MKIPFVDLSRNYRSIKEEIDKNIKDIIESSSFIMGKPVSNFEEQFAKYCGSKYCTGVSNGTVAIELALRAVGIGQGDEVITTPLTFMATVESIINVGAKPVFVDIEKEAYNIDVNQIEEAITPSTKAILIVHLYGKAVDMNSVMKIADKYEIPVIEDCAQAHGALVGDRKVGTFGVAGCFSFFPGKNLGAFGDAGAIVTDDEKIADYIGMVRNHGRKDKYTHLKIGYNQRMDSIQAAILSVKLRHLDKWNELRRSNAIEYGNNLKNSIYKFPTSIEKDNVFHLYVIQTEDRDGLMNYLKEQGISCGVHYPIPLHLQPALGDLGYVQGDFPRAENASETILSLPMFPELQKDEIEYIGETICQYQKM